MKRLGNPGESGVNPTALCRLLYSAGRREETNAPVDSESVRFCTPGHSGSMERPIHGIWSPGRRPWVVLVSAIP